MRDRDAGGDTGRAEAAKEQLGRIVRSAWHAGVGRLDAAAWERGVEWVGEPGP